MCNQSPITIQCKLNLHPSKLSELENDLNLVTQEDISNITSLEIATEEEALEGFDNSKAMTPLTTTQLVYANVGKTIQLGFNGTLEDKIITFESTDTYTLRHNYMYQLDLLFEAVGELDDNTQIIIKNGSDIINITNIIHDDPITPITVGDLKQIQKYSKEFGFRWIFNASYMVTSQGYRIFFMPNVIVDLSDIYSRLEKLEKLLVQET